MVKRALRQPQCSNGTNPCVHGRLEASTGDGILSRPLGGDFDIQGVIGEVVGHYFDRALQQGEGVKASAAQAVLGKIIAGKPVSAMEHRSSVPANVDAAVRCALEKLPADRFTSAQDFVRALEDEHFRYGELATVGADVGVGPWKRLTIATTTLAALLAALAAWGWLSRPPAPEPGVPTRATVTGVDLLGGAGWRLRSGKARGSVFRRRGRPVQNSAEGDVLSLTP